MRSLLAIFALVIPILLGGAGAAVADTVSTSAGQRENFGRMVFAWPQPVGHVSEAGDGFILVRFSRPIETNLNTSIRVLQKYISAAEIGPDGASIIFRLKGNFGLRSYDSGNSVVVDILDANDVPTQTPTGTVNPNAQQPTDKLSVGVRTGIHKGFSRVVFDWPTQVPYNASRDGNKLNLSFQAAGNANIKGLSSGRVPFVKGASVSSNASGTDISLTIDPTSKTRHFKIEKRVVVDVYAPGTIDGAVPIQNTAKQTAIETATTVQDAKPAVVVSANPESTPPAEEKIVEKPVEAVTLEDKPGVKLGAKTEAEAKTAKNNEQSDAPVSLEPKKETVNIGSAAKTENSSDENSTSISSVNMQITKGEGGTLDIKFDWEEPVAAAVFNRAGYLWIIFDKRISIDAPAIAREAAPTILSAEQIETTRGTAIRLKTTAGINPEIKRSGLAWVFEFVRAPMLPSAPLETVAQPSSPLGARLFVSVPEPGEVIVVKDPEAGDNLAVVPVIPLGHGIGRVWSYPQLKLLQTKQGIVIQPLGDDLRVRTLKQGVEVTSASSLQISSVTPEELANVKLEAILAPGDEQEFSKPLTRILDLEKWNRADLKSFIDARQALQLEIAVSKTDKKLEETRLELTRFYFASAFSAETLGIIEIMIKKNPELQKDPEIVLMRGASSLLMGRFEDARTYLFTEELNDNDESAFWRAALAAEEGKLSEVAFDLRRTGAITRPYTKALKMPMATLVASAAVEVGDIKQAGSYIDILNLENPDPSQQNQIDFVAAKLLKLGGDFEGAIGKFEEVMDGQHRPSRAKATVARAQLLLELDRYSSQDMIEEYEKLRFSWRGGEFEFWLLKNLGQLYSSTGMYREGLQALKQAATYFRDYEESSDVTKQMSDLFQKLYLDGAADELAPVTAIALYDEYRELTPAGEKGDEMIRKLADRLVGVDLLERAADLLEGQVEFRLKGAEKARVGARLALVFLFDHKFDDALRILNASNEPNLPDDLVHNRLILRARATIGVGQSDDAIEMLKGNPSADANELRAEVYWRKADWKNASKVLGKLARSYGAKARKPLTDRQAYMVLRWAVAETLYKNENAIERILENYGAAMMKSPYGDAFTLIAQPLAAGLVDFRGLGEILKEVEDFKGFMGSYQDQIGAGKLSEIY